MDIKLEKKPWYIRYRYYLTGGLLFISFLIYVIVLSLGPRKLRVDAENIQIAEVKDADFMEYVDVEGLIQPILTIKVNTREAGSVESIVGEEGSLLQQGDTILILSNPDLLRNIEDQRDEWEKQMITYQEQEIEMEQKSLNLKQQALTNNYELERLKKSIALDREEYQMGVKSKAQLQVAEDEYNYKQKNAALQQESLRHDSAVTMIRKELIRNDRERERKKYERVHERLNNLVVTAPIKGQLRNIEDQRDEWEKQMITYQEQEIEMEQKSLNLKQQALTNNYELERLKKSIALDREEYQMGVKSKAQLQVAEDEYNYKQKNAALQQESLRHDSAVTMIRKELIRNDRERERKKYERVHERLNNLVVTAPIKGQLSFVKVTPGQQVSSGESIAEIKVLDQYKIHTSLSEYYIDRITTGLPATINYQGKKYPLRITKVVPEVKDRMFDVDLVFTDDMPDNVRVGKSFRVQIELGQPEQTLIIPRGNFYQATGGQWIYKVNASKTKAVRVPLSVGRQNPQQYEITEGLRPGDWVITTGYDTFGDAEELILR